MSEENQKMRPPAGGRGGGGMGHGPMGMGAPVQKAKNFKGTLVRLIEYFKPQKISFILVFIFAVLSTLFNIVGPKIMGHATTKLGEGIAAKFIHYMQVQRALEMKMPQVVVNKLIRQPIPRFDFAYIGRIMILLIVLYLISAAFAYAMSYIMSSVAQKTVYKMRNDVKEKLDRIPLRYFDAHTHGEILSRVTNDMDNIATTLQQNLTQFITSAVTVIGILFMMISISPIMTLIAIFTLPASGMLTMFVVKKSQKFFTDQQKFIGQMNGHVEEMFSGHKIVKAFGHEKTSVEKFKQINEDMYKVGWKAQFVSGLIFPAINFVNNIGYVLVCVVGGLLVANGKIKIGDVQAFIQYIRQFTQPIAQLANIANVMQSMVASAERVFEVLDEPEEVADIEESKKLVSPKGAVKFEHVKFGYKEDQLLIQDMNIDVKPGQTIAIVGPTGAGKTTLINLLLRFYEINGGKITVDAINIKEMSRSDLRTMFGMVLQDTWLFNGTIHDNIAYGREGATEEEIINAAKTAHADHFIRTLPEGYNTVLNEEASNVSQGQKQLLTIARAILADPSILILDEATSNVDTRTEVLIQKAMNNLMKGRTSFVIAHRLSTIRDADLILVMKHGSIIEQGTHIELLQRGGFYADLYNSQFTAKGAVTEEIA